MKARINQLADDYRRQIWALFIDDMGRIVTAVMLYVLYKRGWHKDRLRKLFFDVRDTLNMPPIFGKRMDTNTVYDLMEKVMDVDFTEIRFQLETETEERLRIKAEKNSIKMPPSIRSEPTDQRKKVRK